MRHFTYTPVWCGIERKEHNTHESYFNHQPKGWRTESIYRLLAAVLSNNMGKVPVTAEDVEDYDIEECTAILEAYMEFVDELKANPN